MIVLLPLLAVVSAIGRDENTRQTGIKFLNAFHDAFVGRSSEKFSDYFNDSFVYIYCDEVKYTKAQLIHLYNRIKLYDYWLQPTEMIKRDDGGLELHLLLRIGVYSTLVSAIAEPNPELNGKFDITIAVDNDIYLSCNKGDNGRHFSF